MYKQFVTDGAASVGMSLDYLMKPATLRSISSDVAGLSKDELLQRIQKHKRWRYHHGLEELKSRADTYHSYCNRIESMMEAIDSYFAAFKVSLSGKTAIDLACSEGFFTNYFLDKGLSSIDALELSEIGIERFHLVRALKGLPPIDVGQVDFELPFWSEAVKKSYDIVFCLGILYHMENPTFFMKNVAAITKDVLVLETDTPTTETSFSGRGCFHLNSDTVTIKVGESRKVLEFRPDQIALVYLLHHVGFREVTLLPASTKIKDKYFEKGLKTIVVARR